jgi:hypothetical protein
LIEGGIYFVSSEYGGSSSFRGFAAGSRVEGLTALLVDGIENFTFAEASVVK